MLGEPAMLFDSRVGVLAGTDDPDGQNHFLLQIDLDRLESIRSKETPIKSILELKEV